jgi:hypothetical protein
MRERTSRGVRITWLLVLLVASSVGRTAAAGAWLPVGIGDCPGHDVAETAGTSPDESRCTASFAGQTAVCRATGCTYKEVATGLCTGGATPGQMYMCGPTAAASPSPVTDSHAPEPPPRPDSAALPPQAPEGAEANLRGLTLAFGLGVGLGLGDLYASQASGSPLPDGIRSLRGGVTSHFPLSVGLGVRPIRFLSFGLTFAIAPLLMKGSLHSGSNVRYGGEVRLHVMPRRPLSPWLSVGFGHERYDFAQDFSGLGARYNLSGSDLEFQAGCDLRQSASYTLGPYVGVRVGRYAHFSEHAEFRGGQVDDADLATFGKATHAWIALGVRGTLTTALW